MRVPEEVAEEDKNLAALNRVISTLCKVGLNEAADIVQVYPFPFSCVLLFCSLSKTAALACCLRIVGLIY